MKHLTDEELFRLIDGETSIDEQTIYKAHLSQCAPCNHLYNELFAINLQMEKMEVEKPSVDFTEKLMVKLQAENQYQPTFIFSKPSSSFLAVICVFIAFVMILISGFSLGWFNFATTVTNNPGITIPSTSFHQLFQNELLINTFLIIDGLLALVLIDKALLQPYFKKRMQQLAS